MKDYKIQSSSGESAPEILVPLDFTPCSREALYTAIGYAQRFHARILLLHVIDVALDFLNANRSEVSRIEEKIHERAAEEFNWATSTFRNTGVAIETMIAEGLPGEKIVNLAHDRNVFLIVIGQHPAPRRWSLFHRQTVKGVLREAECEVVVVTHSPNPKRKQAMTSGHVRRSAELILC